MLYFSKRPSSTSTIHLPQVAFSAQIDSISTPSSRAAARTDVPSSTCPRRPEGWRITVCFLVIFLWRTAAAVPMNFLVGGGSLFLRTPLPAPKEAFRQPPRVSRRVRPSLRVYTAPHNPPWTLLPRPSRTRQLHSEFFAKAVS